MLWSSNQIYAVKGTLSLISTTLPRIVRRRDPDSRGHCSLDVRLLSYDPTREIEKETGDDTRDQVSRCPWSKEPE